ncbi:hypothetical protein C8J56DRAFT_1056542 [Mycena floridula]|nr:hypothetical protein C8J56DRAFT_1058451 [Mycena floridula]KAJ7582402.1 hypothetical protein C8J56DRAFT_1056542 [Mycena floridula]
MQYPRWALLCSAQLERGDAVQRSRAIGGLLTSAINALCAPRIIHYPCVDRNDRADGIHQIALNQIIKAQTGITLISTSTMLQWFQTTTGNLYSSTPGPRMNSSTSSFAQYPLDPNYRNVTFEE